MRGSQRFTALSEIISLINLHDVPSLAACSRLLTAIEYRTKVRRLSAKSLFNSGAARMAYVRPSVIEFHCDKAVQSRPMVSIEVE